MTEDEAKQKWCPFARCATGDGITSFNRPIGSLQPVTENLCIASDCAVWIDGGGEVEVVDRAKGHAVTHLDRSTGHCGLAGK